MGGWLAGVLVLALLGWFTGVGVHGVLADDLPRTTAARYVPPDAYRDAALFQQGTGQSQATVENAWVRGASLRWAVSPNVFTYSAPPPGSPGGRGARWWREAVVPGDPAQLPRYRVFSVTDSGIRMHGQDWGKLGLTLDPAPVWLPADAHAGQTWTAHGIGAGAGIAGLHDYRARFRAEAAGGGCLRVSATLELTPQKPAANAAPATWTERDLWCQGRGVVDSTGSLGAVAYAVSTGQGRDARLAARDVTDAHVDPAGLGDWRQGTLTGFEGDDTFGLRPMATSYQQPPVVTTLDDVVFGAGATSDVVGLLPIGSGKHWLHWWARPGGQVLSLAAFGRTVLATTTTRELLAYAPGGRLLWSVELGDVAEAPPVRVGDDMLAVATARGEVSLRSAVDGHRVWSHRVPDGAVHQLATDGSVVAVFDTKDVLHVLDARTGDERWQADVSAGASHVVVAGGRTVVGASTLEAFDNATGDLAWHQKSAFVEDLQVSGGSVAAASATGVGWYDLGAGTPLGSVAGAYGPRAAGDTWFVLAGDSVVATDRAGKRLRSWRLKEATARHVVVGPSRVWVFGRSDRAQDLVGEWVGPGD